MITPREMLRDYMTVLNILMQNKELSFEDIVGSAVTLRTDADNAEGISDKKDDGGNGKYTPDDIVF